MFAFSPLSCQTKIHLISDCGGLHECGASLDHPLVQFLCAACGCCCLLGLLLCCCCVTPVHVTQDGMFSFVLCHWRWGECVKTTFNTERSWVYTNTTWKPIQTHTHSHRATPFTFWRTSINTHVLLVPQFGAPWQQYKKTEMPNVFLHVSCFANLQWVCGERKGQLRTHSHTAASHKYTRLLDNEGGQGGIITSHHNNIILLTTPAASSMTVWHFHFTRV